MNSNYFLIGGKDYVIGPNEVTFSAGMTEVSFNVRIIGDEILEGDEIFQLRINSNSLPNDVTVNGPSVVNVTIVDNDGKFCKSLLFIAITFSFNQSTTKFQ